MTPWAVGERYAPAEDPAATRTAPNAGIGGYDQHRGCEYPGDIVPVAASQGRKKGEYQCPFRCY